MKKIIGFLIVCVFTVIFSFGGKATAYADNIIYLGGFATGFSLTTEGAEIVGICDVITENGVKSPANEAGIRIGDIILEIDGTKTDNANDVAKAISDGKEKDFVLDRGGLTIKGVILPEKDISGSYKLGVFIKDDVNGIGTITYIKENEFAALGHPVIASDGSLMKITGGKIYNCSITGVVRGERGRAGELKGIFIGKPYGEITENVISGVYGLINDNKLKLKEIQVGEGVMGDASIFSTVNGEGVKEYKISIIKVDRDNGANKNFVIKIKDKDLIESTGGIVQGMSGSPIVQNGKLIGAVTHVFINDPTRGFAISINKMLDN